MFRRSDESIEHVDRDKEDARFEVEEPVQIDHVVDNCRAAVHVHVIDS